MPANAIVTPRLIVREADKAIAFYTNVFGARERHRFTMPDGRIIDYVSGLADIDARTIRAVGDPDARLGGPADAVLWGQQRHQPQVGMCGDQVDVGGAGAVDTGVVGDQTDPLAAQRRRHIGQEHLDARHNAAGGRRCRRLRAADHHGAGQQNAQQTAAESHEGHPGTIERPGKRPGSRLPWK